MFAKSSIRNHQYTHVNTDSLRGTGHSIWKWWKCQSCPNFRATTYGLAPGGRWTAKENEGMRSTHGLTNTQGPVR